jgi:hypothetical protein
MMNGSFEEDMVVIRMTRSEASSLASELFYTIDYRPEGYPVYTDLQEAVYDALGSGHA